jgi:hypothetical protein
MRFSFACVFVVALTAAACGDGGGPPPPPDVISLAVGQSRTLTASQAATIEVSGGSAGGEFVLVAFHASQVAGSTVPLEFSGTQITGVTGPPTPYIGPTFDALLARAPSTDPDAPDEAGRVHARLRRVERDMLARNRAARSAGASPLYSTSAAAPVPNVGDQMTLNVKLDPACENPDNRTGRVVAVTARTVIVADILNPTGGFSDDEYLAIAQEFDNVAYPTVTQNFGTPPRDVDDNGGRSLVFYTRAVNELTPQGSQSVIGGFFHPRDLFPRTGGAVNCASSNVAEMFYMLVPDPNGEVNGNRRAKDDVRQSTVGVLAHEFQHLINASYRFANNRPAEDVWLNEGLSHVAEELMFYRVSGLAPQQNISVATLTSLQAIEDAFFAYQVDNFGRLIEYLKDPERRAPHTDPMPSDPIDDLATRGAAWQLLRYAADRSTRPQQDLWRSLVNTPNVGISNVTTVFGGNFFDLTRDWATAQYTDDAVSQTTATFQHPSWNYRNVVRALQNPPAFPLKTRTLVAGTPLSFTLTTGGAVAYLRFGVAANTTGTITATSGGAGLPTTVSVTVVRTK